MAINLKGNDGSSYANRIDTPLIITNNPGAGYAAFVTQVNGDATSYMMSDGD